MTTTSYELTHLQALEAESVHIIDKVVTHLGDTLDALGVEPDVRDQVAAVLVAQREHIVTASASV